MLSVAPSAFFLLPGSVEGGGEHIYIYIYMYTGSSLCFDSKVWRGRRASVPFATADGGPRSSARERREIEGFVYGASGDSVVLCCRRLRLTNVSLQCWEEERAFSIRFGMFFPAGGMPRLQQQKLR